jgi:aspartate kinase
MVLAKFGGSSMATAHNIRLCADIVAADPQRTAIVVSAMGKADNYNEKVTDQLMSGKIDEVFARFEELANDLLPPGKLSQYKLELHKTKNKMQNSPDDKNYIVSRGEYLTAKLFALYLDFNFVDAYDIIVINPDSTADCRETYRNIKKQKLKSKMPFVIGGFYGRDKNGRVALFSRGGSDYTGAVIAVLLKCKLYENWTDANGIQTADPRYIYGTRTTPCLNFDALDILTHNGATIIHENVAKLLKRYKTPLKVDNTFNPNKNWTEVHSRRCRNCSTNFFSITHKNDKILVVYKSQKSIKTETHPTSPETLTPDIQALHNRFIGKKS